MQLRLPCVQLECCLLHTAVLGCYVLAAAYVPFTIAGGGARAPAVHAKVNAPMAQHALCCFPRPQHPAR